MKLNDVEKSQNSAPRLNLQIHARLFQVFGNGRRGIETARRRKIVQTDHCDPVWSGSSLSVDQIRQPALKRWSGAPQRPGIRLVVEARGKT